MKNKEVVIVLQFINMYYKISGMKNMLTLLEETKDRWEREYSYIHTVTQFYIIKGDCINYIEDGV